ncbi:prolyl oligopeptidase family serine peptidase [Kaistella sp. 97-N-M2]|uniref:alpha/beta hydrolase family protein n=1 Tax=Kaistella sp. 97-N-M2 TaxID=2908645 RepID=UPI001F302AD4|nr:prolyl oligopeptidase family serine peptidase [Kaistella sp. 97-N-M2]UJF28794.1 prolyl oligopeptidase family serine peptidase [Kaistella sp. 97-N-M2]
MVLHHLSFFCLPWALKSQSLETVYQRGWHRLYNGAVSDDGKWTFFTRIYDGGKSEGVLQNTNTLQPLIIEAAGKFDLDNHHFIVLNGKRELLWKDLRGGTSKIYPDVSDFVYDTSFETLIVKTGATIRWLDLKKGTQHLFDSIIKTQDITGSPCSLLWNETQILLLNRAYGKLVRVLDVKDKLVSAVAETDKPNIKLLWENETGYWMQTVDHSGNSVTSPEKMEFGTSVGALSFLSSNTLMEQKPLISGGSIVTDSVEVWSSADKAVKPRLINMASTARDITLYDVSGCGSPPKTYRKFLTEPYVVFGEDYILEVAELENYDYKVNDISPRPKIRLRNRKTDEIEMEVQEVRGVYPSGNWHYLLYFKGRDWYRYDVLSRKTVNLTSSLKADFYSFDRLNTKVLFPVDSPWFSCDYRFIYLTSKNDIWQYDIKKRLIVQLTDHTGPNYSFRIVAPFRGGGVSKMKWHQNPVLQTKHLALKISDKSGLRQGLALWKDHRLRVILPPGIQSVTYVRMGQHAMSYVKQNANLPPQVIVYPFGKIVGKTTYDSGKGMNYSHFPKTELCEWTDSNGEKTYTTIVLPPDYSPEKKYPAIVRVYENEAQGYTEFEFPTFRNATGFNRTLMAMNGYIVILPRIIYSKNKVGNSAVRAVEETVKKVQSLYSVDSANIGIIGHSFGGYETNYILTQSSLFKSAVSGSGIADIIADYFTVHKMYLNSNISRYTNEQFGFSDGFFALKKEYLENNPILMADQIKTPLLLWSGNKDEHVEWRQSVEMFMALSSLKKEVRLVLFPDDVHVLTKPKNQIDATEKILGWFGYYLKNGEKPKWF